ncbi:glycyl-tRNA synthetase beta chain [Nitrosospira sp. Nsp2]|uniref:glycine--tRNA ligase subunit beta n=1 Tax=Nitrosospira sp. Nsp2 TaxID=136548 RepID=UPI000D2FCF4A|nr:glycine--tRNA ligase subunit beta [Nitrosospira sp. Nsp2]PTR15743.1 glycyl-tRNA synthetase beta chain [Nitrosospira sp. Nsp2]
MGGANAGEYSLSNATKNLLIELLVEELPPKSLRKLGNSFATELFEQLKKDGLLAETSRPIAYASPRRLGVHITDVRSSSPERVEKKKLMPSSIAFNPDNSWSEALRKRLAKDQIYPVDIERGNFSLVRSVDGSTEYIYLEGTNGGEPLSRLLNLCLIFVIREKLPIAKAMTYQRADGWTDETFVRPAHALVALHGADIVPGVEALGLTAGRTTKGHRFEVHVETVELRDADSYEQQLEIEGAVIASFEKRRNAVIGQLQAATAGQGLIMIQDEALLDEVTALVERPNVLVGEFDRKFLDVPQECLILTMKANQKYFPLIDENGKLSHKFLIVSNVRPADASQIITGNERVLRSRLADAKFFFDQDRKKTLASRVEGLRRVVYHNKLGTQAERVERIWAIAQAIGLKLGGNELAAQAGEAAMLCKADLLTDMVGEFPELQGVMGCYYAKHDGLSDDVAYAIEDHYRPRFAGDELPRNTTGLSVALADKLETLVGMFGIGQVPTGDKDPFALRRHALGVVRILVEQEVPLPLDTLLRQAVNVFNRSINDPSEALSRFIYERLRHYFSAESFDEHVLVSGKRVYVEPADRIFSPQQIDAVLALRPQLLSDVKKRLYAVRAFAALPEAESLAATNKRVGNILKKADANIEAEVDAGLLQEPAEQDLHRALSRIAPQAEEAFAAGDYSTSLQILAGLKGPVDGFFDHVMVNTEDESLRHNRLALLAQLQQAMNRVANISKLA